MEVNDVMKIPGSLATLYTFALLLPLLGFASKDFSNLMTSVVSLPLILTFLIETIFLTDTLDVKTHLFSIISLSFFTYFIPNLLIGEEVIQLLALFMKSLFFSLLIVYFYYLLYVFFKESPLSEHLREKRLFLISYILSILLMLPVFYMFSHMGLLG